VKCGDACGHFMIGLAEEEGAGDEDIGAVEKTEARGGEVNAAVHFDIDGKIAAGDFGAEGGDFWEHVVHKGLAAEAGLDGHDEDHVTELEEGEDGGGVGDWFEDEAGLGAEAANGVERRQDFMLRIQGGGFEMNSDEIGASVNELRCIGDGVVDHKMDIKRECGAFSERTDDGRADSKVRNEVGVHDIDVNIIGAGAFGAGDFVAEAGEISCEDRRCNESVHSRSIIAKTFWKRTMGI